MDRIAHFGDLVRRQPDNELFRFSFAQALEQSGRYDEAVEQYRHCVAKKPDWMMAQILLGKRLLALGHRDAARSHLEQALQLAIDQAHEDPEQELRALLAGL